MSYGLLQAAARVKGIKPHERCVLINLADRANRLTKRCYPSVGRIAEDTSVSVREVYRALKALRDAGLVTIVGKTKYGSNLYVLNLSVEHADNSKEGEALSSINLEIAQLADPQCHTGSHPLTNWQTNNGTEPGTEGGKKNIYTSGESPLSHTLDQNHKNQEGQNQGEHAPYKPPPPPIAPAPLPVKKDSKLVQAWKTAHAKAGMECVVTGIDGKKLSQLVKGKNAIPYQQAIEILIPRCVAEWKTVCTILAYWYGVHHLGKKPFPKQPHAGMVLYYKKAIMKFFLQSESEQESLISLFSPKSGNCAFPDLFNKDETDIHPLECKKGWDDLPNEYE